MKNKKKKPTTTTTTTTCVISLYTAQIESSEIHYRSRSNCICIKDSRVLNITKIFFMHRKCVKIVEICIIYIKLFNL